ncbi:MAG: hypothetical protein ACRDD8_02950 [Bacteroidales bacterium]
MAISTIVLLVIVYILSFSVNILLFDKVGVLDQKTYHKDDKVMITLFFVPFFNTFLALIGVVFGVRGVVRKIKF